MKFGLEQQEYKSGSSKVRKQEFWDEVQLLYWYWVRRVARRGLVISPRGANDKWATFFVRRVTRSVMLPVSHGAESPKQLRLA